MSDMPEVIWVDSGRKGSDWWTREADQDDCALGYEWDTQYTRTDIVDDLTTQLANMTIERNGHKANAREAVIARDNLTKQLAEALTREAETQRRHDAKNMPFFWNEATFEGPPKGYYR